MNRHQTQFKASGQGNKSKKKPPTYKNPELRNYAYRVV